MIAKQKRKTSAMILILAALVRPALTHANPELKTVCGSTGGKTTAGQQGEIRAQNCKAAEDAQSAADKNGALYKVWGAVAVVCTSVCGSSVAGASPNSAYCTGSSIAAGGVDAAYSKDFMAAMSPAQSAVMNQMRSGGQQTVQQGQQAAQQGQSKGTDLGACMTAATASQSAMTKYKSMKSSEDTVASSLKSVKDMKSKDDVPAVNGSGAGPQAEMAAAEAGDPSMPSATGDVSDSSGSDPCSRASATKGFGDTLRCASMHDPSVPSFIAQPQFQKDFQKIAGVSLPDFFASDEPPSRAIARAAAGGTGDTGSATRLASLLDSGAGNTGAGSNYETASTYSGGGASGGTSGSGDDAMGQMLSGLLQQMMPQDAEDAKRQESLKMVIFANNEANKRRSPASLAENTSLNIFDRVTYRYYYVSARILNGGDAR